MKNIKSTRNIKEIISILNDKSEGFVCIENIIEKKLLNEIKYEIKNYLDINENSNYFSISNPLKGNFKSLKDLDEKVNLIKFIEKLTHEYLSYFFSPNKVNNILKKDNIYSVMRYVSGSKTSMAFHYDKTLITILIPISIPKIDINKSGHLIAFTNSRPIKNTFLNFIDKIILQNQIYKRLFSLKKISSNTIKIMREGNIYIMNGYKTIHGNFPVDGSQERITLLLHYGNPHIESKLLNLITYITTKIKKIKKTKIS